MNFSITKELYPEPNYGLHFLEYQWNPPNDSSVLSVMIPSTIMWFK